MGLFLTFVDILFLVLFCAIILRAISSWFPIRYNKPLLITLHQITDPILVPLRRVIPTIGMFDITPMVAIFLLWSIWRLLHVFLS